MQVFEVSPSSKWWPFEGLSSKKLGNDNTSFVEVVLLLHSKMHQIVLANCPVSGKTAMVLKAIDAYSTQQFA